MKENTSTAFMYSEIYRQINNDPRSARFIVLNINKTVMIMNNCIYYCKAQAGSMFFCRKIGFKNPQLVVRWYAHSIVGNLYSHHLVFFIICNIDYHLSIAFNRGYCVIQKINHYPFYLLSIHLEYRDPGYVMEYDLNVFLDFLIQANRLLDYLIDILGVRIHGRYKGKTGKFVYKTL